LGRFLVDCAVAQSKDDGERIGARDDSEWGDCGERGQEMI